MSDFWLYVNLGFEHAFDFKAYEHVLFLLLACAAYTFSAWRRLLLVVTVFTLAHCLSVLLAANNIVSVSGKWIAWLIPILLLLVALSNLFTAGKEKLLEKIGFFYIASAFFGLIHGFGYASEFKSVAGNEIVLPLLEFALGIEIGQIAVVIGALILTFLFQFMFRFNKKDWVLVVSSIAIGMLIPMLMNQWIN